MNKQFLMPDIGEGVVEGQVVMWLKKIGESVSKDEPVLILMTDKATVEIPTPYVGKLTKQFYEVGQMAKKGLPLFEIEVDGQEEDSPTKIKDQPVAHAPPSSVQNSIQPKPQKALCTPPVRKLAKDLNIDLEMVVGTGPQGIVTREDIKKFQRLPSLQKDLIPHLDQDKEFPLTGIKQAMAEKMVESAKTIPHFSLFNSADATRLIQLKNNMAKEAQKKNLQLTFMPFFIKALSLVLNKHPELNSSLDTVKNNIIIHAVHNIGIAMSSPLGLIVPVLHDVNRMNLHEIILAYEELKEKSKHHKLPASAMKNGTCTLTNFGAFDKTGSFATPIINYPETAILGVGRIVKEPKAYHGEVAIRDVLHCCWSFDHRVIDGQIATHASNAFIHFIENPADLL